MTLLHVKLDYTCQRKLFAYLGPGLDIEANLRVLTCGQTTYGVRLDEPNTDTSFDNIVVHVGTNDARTRQTEVTKATYLGFVTSPERCVGIDEFSLALYPIRVMMSVIVDYCL